MNEPTIFVIGAAARATASIVRRTGLRVGRFDAYGDEDPDAEFDWVEVIGFDDHVPGISAEAFRKIVGERPWLYTGPLENAPDWLERASQGTTLWGNSADICRVVRDPFALARVVSETDWNVRFPETRCFEDRPGKLRTWIWKPSKSTGGWRTRRAHRFRHACKHVSPSGLSPGYWQKFVSGRTFGATVASDGGKSVLIGLCESFRGAPGRPFAYAGSAGPAHDASIRRAMPELDRLAQMLTLEFGLKGVWNFDLVHCRRKGLWYLLEINPRMSASMEVLDLAVRPGLFDIHRKIFELDQGWFDLANERRLTLERTDRRQTKTVIYAKHKLRVSQLVRAGLLVREFGRDESLWPDVWHFADWPRAGTVIEAGCPACTLYSMWSFEGVDAEGSSTQTRIESFGSSDEQPLVE